VCCYGRHGRCFAVSCQIRCEIRRETRERIVRAVLLFIIVIDLRVGVAICRAAD
jgi:hypothetical protein